MLGLPCQKVFRRPTLALVEVEHLAGVRDETGHSRSRGCVRGRQKYTSILHFGVRKGVEVAIDEQQSRRMCRRWEQCLLATLLPPRLCKGHVLFLSTYIQGRLDSILSVMYSR